MTQFVQIKFLTLCQQKWSNSQFASSLEDSILWKVFTATILSVIIEFMTGRLRTMNMRRIPKLKFELTSCNLVRQHTTLETTAANMPFQLRVGKLKKSRTSYRNVVYNCVWMFFFLTFQHTLGKRYLGPNVAFNIWNLECPV